MHAQRVVFPREHVQCYSKYDRRELQSRGEPGRRLRPTHLYFREYNRRERRRRRARPASEAIMHLGLPSRPSEINGTAGSVGGDETQQSVVKPEVLAEGGLP